MSGPTTGRILPEQHALGGPAANHRPVTVNPVDAFGNAAQMTEAHSPFVKNIIDEALAPATTYVGYAAPGTALGDAKWRIQRISVVGAITITEYALTAAPGSGSAPDLYGLYDKVWDDRATFTYG